MGIFSQEVRREFIARPDTAKGQIFFKWPDTNIRKLTQLTAEQDELAAFFRDGRGQATIQPGRGTSIRKLTQRTVEQVELAVFFRDARVQGTIRPGRVTLDSSEIPFRGIL